MPRKSEWLERVPSAISELQDFPAPVIDRATVERLLGIRRREAIRLMHRFGGFQAGKTFLIGREELLGCLERLQSGDDWHAEIRRRERLMDKLDRARRETAARRVPIQAERTDVRPATGLSPRIRLVPGKLEVEFDSPEQLLTRLFELAQAIADDVDGFTKLLEVPQ